MWNGGGYPIPGPGGGYPIPGLDGGYPILLMGGGGVPHPRSVWEYPIPDLDREVLYPRSGQGVYYIPGLDRGVPHPADGGTPSKIRTGVPQGTPHHRLDWVPPCQRLDGVPPLVTPPTPFRTRWGTPFQDWMG